MRLAAAALVSAALAALVPAAPAFAHGGDAPAGTNYRTTVTAVRPAVAGVTVRAVEAGARLALTNHSGRTIEVLGYQGEPYLEIRPDGVYENVNSPATYLNQTLTGGTEPPATADPAAAPSWRRTSTDPVARWHDHRVHWMESDPPPAVAAAPDRTHRIRDWVVPLRDGVSTMEVRGTLDWVPPPTAGLWWALCLLGVALITWLGTRFRLVVAPVAVAAGVLALAYGIGREVDAGSSVAVGLLTSQLFVVLTAVAAVAAGAYLLTRRPTADFLVALAGACLLVSAGIPNATVFSRGVAPVPWDATWARVAIAAIIIAGGSATLTGIFRIRRVARLVSTG